MIKILWVTFYCIFVSASPCKTNACLCNKAQMGFSEFCGCAEINCQNKWYQQINEELDDDHSEDESDIVDECQYECSDEEWK